MFPKEECLWDLEGLFDTPVVTRENRFGGIDELVEVRPDEAINLALQTTAARLDGYLPIIDMPLQSVSPQDRVCGDVSTFSPTPLSQQLKYSVVQFPRWPPYTTGPCLWMVHGCYGQCSRYPIQGHQ